jgi:methionyl-tRNA formyltransferase
VSARAVAFAYHDVGVRCLSVLLAHGVEVALVVTHRDDPRENIWFGSVERLARDHGLEVATPEDPAASGLAERMTALSPDFIFSFYYRHMLPARVLAAARRGAFNVHGSLLPKYRGRVPVNWAILRGETETGATLHEMVEKPDAGRIVDQMAVPILPDDVALDVFRKVTVAAELVLHRSLPRLIDGTAAFTPQDLSRGSYFGGRKPEDGRVDWKRGAREIHDLVRAVAPPYPGAFTTVGTHELRLLRTRVGGAGKPAGRAMLHPDAGGRLVARCADGIELIILESDFDGQPSSASVIRERLGTTPLPLGESA